MKIAVLGVNHKLANVQLREKIAKSCQRHFSSRAPSFDSCKVVLLSTCNRTEVYFSSLHLAETHSQILNLLRADIDDEFDQKLYTYFGPDCFSHLCRVTAGLDSAILGETDIQGQVKQAYEQAHMAESLPKELHYLFQKALAIGKRIRSSIPITGPTPSIEHAILHAGQQALRDFTKSSILFVGASSINRKLLDFFHHHGIDKDITLCNRSYAGVQQFAAKYALKLLPWESLSHWYKYDWVICGTKATEHLITKESLPRKIKAPKLLIDLGVPRNIDPKVERNKKIILWNIDQLASIEGHEDKNLQIFNQADAIVNDATERHLWLFRQKEERQKRATS
jgi:glutamyl-tRNA reductase